MSVPCHFTFLFIFVNNKPIQIYGIWKWPLSYLLLLFLISDSWSYLIGLKPVFSLKVFEFFLCNKQKIILCEIYLNSSKISLNPTLQNLEKIKNSVWMEVTVDGDILCCQPFWMAAITKNHKNDCHGSMVEIETCNKHQEPLSLDQS